MMASIPAYNEYATKVLMPGLDQTALAEIKKLEAEGKYSDPRYMDLLMKHHYIYHVLRMPADQWPDPVNRAFKHMNPAIYIPMQGPSELGASGKLLNWDRTADLGKITVPTSRSAAATTRWTGPYGDDVESGEARTLPVSRNGQSHGHVRRSAELHDGAHRFSGCRCWSIDQVGR